MKKILLVLISLFISQEIVKAQITRGQWEYRPVITTTNNGYGWFAENLKWAGIGAADLGDVWYTLRGIIPTFRSRFDVLKDIDTPNGDVKVRWWDFGLRNYALGYHVAYMPSVSPIGFDFQLDYEKQNWRAKFPGRDSYENYEKRMIVPTLLLKGRFGDYVSNNYNIIVEAGAKYNHVLKAKGEFNDKKSLNNGFTGIIGLGVMMTTFNSSIQIRYEHDFFNYFNKDYTIDRNIKPYEKVTSKHGSLNIYISVLGI